MLHYVPFLTPDFKDIPNIRNFKIPNNFYSDKDVFLFSYNIWLYWDQHHPIKFNIFVQKIYLPMLEKKGIILNDERLASSITFFMIRYPLKIDYSKLSNNQKENLFELVEFIGTNCFLHYKLIVNHIVFDNVIQSISRQARRKAKRKAEKNQSTDDVLKRINDLKEAQIYLTYDQGLAYYDTIVDSNLTHFYEYIKEDIFQEYRLEANNEKSFYAVSDMDAKIFYDVCMSYYFTIYMNDTVIKYMFMFDPNTIQRDNIHVEKFNKLLSIIFNLRRHTPLQYMYKNLHICSFTHNNKILTKVLHDILPLLGVYDQIKANDDIQISQMFRIIFGCMLSQNIEGYKIISNVLNQTEIKFFETFSYSCRLFFTAVGELPKRRALSKDVLGSKKNKNVTVYKLLLNDIQKNKKENEKKIDNDEKDELVEYYITFIKYLKDIEQEKQMLEYENNLTPQQMNEFKRQYDLYSALHGPFDEIYITKESYVNPNA